MRSRCESERIKRGRSYLQSNESIIDEHIFRQVICADSRLVTWAIPLVDLFDDMAVNIKTSLFFPCEKQRETANSDAGEHDAWKKKTTDISIHQTGLADTAIAENDDLYGFVSLRRSSRASIGVFVILNSEELPWGGPSFVPTWLGGFLSGICVVYICRGKLILISHCLFNYIDLERRNGWVGREKRDREREIEKARNPDSQSQ